jgi:3-deoxy-manno-octulosonate cytidylyltransferase (CMP-KDO synthetase)
MTSEECPSGTHRLIELLKSGKVDGDIFVNWQGDEPFICESMIVDLLQSSAHDKSDVWTLKKRIMKEEELHNPHIAKVVCDVRGFALYFSRSQIPYYRDIADFSQKIVYKHVGLYAYTRQALEEIDTLPLSPLEHAEQLEMLRFLSHGLKIRVHETDREVMGIDLPEHLATAESYL